MMMNEKPEEVWSDWEEEDGEDVECIHCFFCLNTFDTPTSMFTHALQQHAFDWPALTHDIDLYGKIQMVNYIRTIVLQEGIESDCALFLNQELKNAIKCNDETAIFRQQQYFSPVLENDALLYQLDTDTGSDAEPEEEEIQHDSTLAVSKVEEQLKACQTLLRNITTEVNEKKDDDDDGVDIDTYYFDSYAATGIHREMIEDTVRTESYRRAIEENASSFKNKIVLDVGCGTGILSLFAARAGAAHVYAVDCSALVATTRTIITDNHYEDTITVLSGKIEEIELPVQHVDIIISEWMGYCLLYESMLDSVLFAREKWLKETGKCFPDGATMFLQGVTDLNRRTDFWKNVYGFNMSAMIPKVCLKEPFVEAVSSSAVLTDRVCVKDFNLEKVKYEDLNYTSSFTLHISKEGTMHGLVSSFDIAFEKQLQNPVFFSTGVESTTTHWQQVYFAFNTPLTVSEDTSLVGTWSLRRNAKNQRFIDVDLTWSYNSVTYTQHYEIQ